MTSTNWQWNPDRGVWETPDIALCGHHGAATDAWPAWGVMLNGATHTDLTTPPSSPHEEPDLLPTHRVAATRNSRKSMVDNPQWSAPALEQVLEIMVGTLPREFRSWQEVPGKLRPTTIDILPTPTAHDTGRNVADYKAMKANMPGGPRTAITSLAVAVQVIAEPDDSIETPATPE